MFTFPEVMMHPKVGGFIRSLSLRRFGIRRIRTTATTIQHDLGPDSGD